MAYTDLTSEFEYKDLVTWINLDALAENDDFDVFRSGTGAIFFQASAPTGWTKQTTHNDKALRVVSGSGGGSGGATTVSSTITLAHSHTVTHTHSLSNHVHLLDSSQINNVLAAGTGISSNDSDGATLFVETTGGVTVREFKPDLRNGGSGTSGSASPGTNSQLSNYAIAYADIIVCMKDA